MRGNIRDISIQKIPENIKNKKLRSTHSVCSANSWKSCTINKNAQKKKRKTVKNIYFNIQTFLNLAHL